MKRILRLTLVGFALTVALLARAGSPYQDGDVLLIFRESGFNDVEFDIGNISQFLNQANGYSTPVTGWSLSTVTGVFGTDLTGVSVVVAATQARTNIGRLAWLSSASNVTAVNDITPSAWQSGLWSVIDSIGSRPLTYLVPTTGTTGAYSIDPNGTYKLAAYDTIVSGNGVNGGAIPQLGGSAAFTVEGAVPGTLGFWQIQGTNANPKPAAAYVGTFGIDASGHLTFTAGPAQAAQPTILGITRAGSISTVTFTTASSGNYSLVYTNVLGSPVTTWPAVGASVPGDGANHSLTHTNSTDSAGFYGIVRLP
jgi:hypothetical protein